MKDEQDIFDSEVPAQTTEGVSPEAPPRDEAGRFAAKDQGEAAPEAAPSAPPALAEKAPRDIPIQALLDERDKRKMLEAQVAALQRQQAPQKLPDPVEDAAGYTRAIQEHVEQLRQSDRLAMSQFLAEDKFGKEMVDEAMAFFDTQPRHVSAQFLTERSPFHAAVQWYQSHKAMQERTSPDYETKLRDKIKAELMAEMQQQVQPSTRIPRSLAQAGSTGGEPPPVSGDPLFN